MKCDVLFLDIIYKYIKTNLHTVARVVMFYLWRSLALTIRRATCIVENICVS